MSDQGGSSGRAVLTVTSGAARGATIAVDETLLIGRHAPAAGRLGGDQQLSRTHALISRIATGGYVIQDLGSMNGTFVNSKQISEAQQLSAGDKIELGETVLVVTSAEAPPAAPAEAPPAAPAEAPPAAPAVAGAPGHATGPSAVPSPLVTLRIDVDVDRGEASIRLDEGADRVNLVQREGRWRLVAGE